MTARRVSLEAVAADVLAPKGSAANSETEAAVRRLVTVEAAQVKERAVEWEWYRRIPRAALTVVEGDPDVGKTAFMLDFLARKSAGAPLGDGEPTEPRRISIVGAEDALESVAVPRLREAGADLTKIRLVTGALEGTRAPKSHLRLPSDLYLLALELADRDILAIDGSINDYAERGIRPGDDVAMRELVGSVQDLARDSGKTAIIGRHLRKGGSVVAGEAGSGTMGIMAKARSVLGLYQDPKDPEIRLLARVKCNLAPAVITLRLRLYSKEPDSAVRVGWLGEDHRSANEIREQIHRAERGSDRDQSAAARHLVLWLSDGGPKPVQHLKPLAEKTGLSWKAFERAREKLGVVTERMTGQTAGWAWKDPFFASREQDHGEKESGTNRSE